MYRFCLIYLILSLFIGCNPANPGISSRNGGGGKGGSGGTGTPGNGSHGNGATGDGWTMGGDVVDPDLALVSFITQGLVFPNIEKLVDSSVQLESGIHMACNSSEKEMTEIRGLWSQAMIEFHKVETLPFGVLDLENDTIMGFVYSLPQQGANALIQDEVSKAELAGDSYKPRRPRPAFLGLDALEYVLFGIMKDQTQLAPATVECSYLKYVSTDLTLKTQLLKSKFQEKELDFLQTPDGKTRLKEYIGIITDSLFFADTGLKSRKILAPMGEKQDTYACTAGVNCHTLYLEHPWSPEMAKQAVMTNMETLEQALYGIPGYKKSYSFVDLLRYLETQQGEVFNLESGIEETKNIWAQMPTGENYYLTFEKIQEDNANTQILKTFVLELREVTGWLKSDFLTSLNVELPGGVQGDND